jgi:hypothetical protein
MPSTSTQTDFKYIDENTVNIIKKLVEEIKNCIIWVIKRNKFINFEIKQNRYVFDDEVIRRCYSTATKTHWTVDKMCRLIIELWMLMIIFL